MGILRVKRREANRKVAARGRVDLFDAVSAAMVAPSVAVTAADCFLAYQHDHEARNTPSRIDITSKNTNWLLPAFRDLEWQCVDPQRMLGLRRAMEAQNKSPSTVLGVLAQARAAMTFCHARGMIAFNPLPTLRGIVPAKRSVKKRDQKLLGQHGFESLVNHNAIEVRDRVLYITATTIGARSAEATELRPSDIKRGPEGAEIVLSRQFSRKRKEIAPLKEGGGSRVIPLRWDVLGIIDWWIQVGRPMFTGEPTHPDDLLFVEMRPEPLGRRRLLQGRMLDKTVLTRFKRHLALCDLEERVFHSLRHTFVAMMLDAGVSLDVVKHFTHPDKRGRAIDTYAHYSPRLLREAVEKPQLKLPSFGQKEPHSKQLDFAI